MNKNTNAKLNANGKAKMNVNVTWQLSASVLSQSFPDDAHHTWIGIRSSDEQVSLPASD